MLIVLTLVYVQLMGDVMHYERGADDGRSLGHDLEYLILHDNVSVRSRFDPEDDEDDATYKFVMIPSRNPGRPSDTAPRELGTSRQKAIDNYSRVLAGLF